MRLEELIAQFRVDADDAVTPYLWSDAAVITWLNEAIDEACKRSELIVDSSNPEICIVTAAVGSEFIEYDKRIIRIKRAKPGGQNFVVPVKTVEEMDCIPKWESETGTVLKALVLGMGSYKLRTYPIMTADVQINLTVQRIPLCALSTNPKEEPEINPRYHIKLLHWVQHKAYSIDDVDANDPRKSLNQLKMFEMEFGPKISISQEEFIRQNAGRDLVTGFFA